MIPGHKIYSGDMEMYMNCLMHFRRLETIHTGMRFFDLKRLRPEAFGHRVLARDRQGAGCDGA